MYEYTATILNIVDGDTIDLEVNLGFDIQKKLRIRLARINAPEMHGLLKDSAEYQKGLASKKFVEDFSKQTNSKVRIVTLKDKAEKYGRYLAEVFAVEGAFKDKNLNNEMLTFGFAVLYND